MNKQSSASQHRVVISVGDPAGIGAEVILKALGSSKLPSEMQPLLVGCKNKGKHFRVEKEKPMCDLFVSLLHKHNVDIHHFGDSTGELNVV